MEYHHGIGEDFIYILANIILFCFYFFKIRYYPYHYGPFASDFQNLQNVTIEFDQNTKPFTPFEQMMATFSPRNAEYLPEKWRPLMTNEDSRIIEFYPKEFEIDPNGKTRRSQYIAKLTFVDENKLLQALQPFYSTLTDEEKERNKLGNNLLFVHKNNSSYKQWKDLYTQNNQKITFNGILPGYIWLDEEINTQLNRPTSGNTNSVICVKYCSTHLSKMEE